MFKPEELDILKRNLKALPYENMKVILNTYPYILSPWEHWNKLIDAMKDKEKQQITKQDDNQNNDIQDNQDNQDNQIDDIKEKKNIYYCNNIDNGYVSEISMSDYTDSEDENYLTMDNDNIIEQTIPILKWDGD